MERDQMMRHLIFGGALAVTASAVVTASVLNGDGAGGFSGPAIEMSGISETRTLDLVDFDKVRVRGGYEVELKAGADYSIELEGDTAILDSLVSHVEQGELVIEPDNARYNLRDFEGIELRLSMPTLTVFTVDGAAEAVLSEVDSENLSLIINGAGDIEAAGKCGSLTATANGAGEIKAKNLICENVMLTINGAGEMDAYASQSVSITLNGVGEIDVYGNPSTVKKNQSGIGDITIHGAESGSE